jgi:hypothetical protein
MEVEGSIIAVFNVRRQIPYLRRQGLQCLHLELCQLRRRQISSVVRAVLLQGRDHRCAMAWCAPGRAHQASLPDREILQRARSVPARRVPVPGAVALRRRHQGVGDVAGGEAALCREARGRAAAGRLPLCDLRRVEHGHRDRQPRRRDPVFSQLRPARETLRSERLSHAAGLIRSVERSRRW